MSHENPPADHVITDDKPEGQEPGVPIEENLKSRSTWMRLLFMVVFYVLATLASAVGSVVVVLGFFWVLFTGEVNRELRQIGQAIATYMFEMIRYMTFNTEDKPFPFGGAWPSGESKDPS